MVQAIRKFMLSSPAWVIFALMGAGSVISLLARFDSVRAFLNPLFLLMMSILPPIVAAFWYFSVITGANRALPQFKQSTLTLSGILLVFYGTLPLFDQVILAFAADRGHDSISTTIATILALWGIVGGVGILLTSYIASKSLFGFISGGNPDLADLFLGFFGFWVYPVGVWFLQPKLNSLHDHLSGVPPNKRLHLTEMSAVGE